MAIDRRRLLQFTGTGCALALLSPVPGNAPTTLRKYQVRDAVAQPRFDVGDVVLADTGVVQFAGAGLYLYPAWGEPRLYDIRAAGQHLEFRNPGTGRLLWTQSAQFASDFAGRVLEAHSEALVLADCPAVSVPARPTAA